jgi:hypothetical protein
MRSSRSRRRCALRFRHLQNISDNVNQPDEQPLDLQMLVRIEKSAHRLAELSEAEASKKCQPYADDSLWVPRSFQKDNVNPREGEDAKEHEESISKCYSTLLYLEIC